LRKQRLLIDKKDQENWINESIGTVHTFQGKEADTVIFCLGIDKKTGRGAARWTASKPNILNVAITRARYRFVVIGDIDLWGELLYFRELIKYLPVEKWG
jgi:superfamily I DNA and/or RNA helicase